MRKFLITFDMHARDGTVERQSATVKGSDMPLDADGFIDVEELDAFLFNQCRDPGASSEIEAEVTNIIELPKLA